MHITGGCHCGHVRYEAEIDPERISICHCTDCQTLTGSPFRITALTTKDRVTLTAATPKIYRKTGGSGRIRLMHFCAECGAPLFGGGEDGVSNDLGVRWGSIDQRTELTPKRQIWCGSAVPWVGVVPDLPGRPAD
jgi:hypothetical protein